MVEIGIARINIVKSLQIFGKLYAATFGSEQFAYNLEHWQMGIIFASRSNDCRVVSSKPLRLGERQKEQKHVK